MSANIRVGRKVLFVGGTEAGNVRVIPDSHGDVIKGSAGVEEYYKIWPIKMKGSTDEIFFAYAADQHPMKMLIDMWREYSPAAQIRRGADNRSYDSLKPVAK